jgi:hypothetical protein
MGRNITLHLKWIYKEGELEEQATCKESLHVQSEGKTYMSLRGAERRGNLGVYAGIGWIASLRSQRQDPPVIARSVTTWQSVFKLKLQKGIT